MTVDCEAILREWWRSTSMEPWQLANVPDSELLNLGRRYMDAAYEDAAQVAAGMALAEVLTTEDTAHNFGVRLAVDAIAAALGEGE